MVRPESLSTRQARRVALAAQGFANTAKLARREPFKTALDRVHVLQIDSVNVFARSHYLPVFSRHGGYDRDQFDQLLWESGEYTEYWAHEAAFIRVEDRPLFAWRMREFEKRYADVRESLAAHIDHVRSRLSEGEAMRARDLELGRRDARGTWWDWSDTKRAVEVLFATGEVVSAGRTRFERRYALASSWLSEAARAELPRADAQLKLIEQASRSLGVATLDDLADYHRLKKFDAIAAVRELELSGALIPVHVEGWLSARGEHLPAWMHRDAHIPPRLAPDALLTPFDPVVWFRPRTERLFNFHYRIEIYTPKAKRRYGYYCLPLMVGGNLVGRIDLKADREANHLLVQAAWQEPTAPARTAEVAQVLLRQAADWHGLERVLVSGVGNLPLPSRF